ncbi:hypothetical protein BD324DRAFT_656992 [Kockovaella imperatae]|uniref:Bromo domain-containing protein n=1 Tax=Kockovaella imperatae TaxID=4999 RepID=A0A1Y1UFZ9_9TREE|nr:hypothetical protein BD324DRAFT_656992 [Kockovaella imperatae]ORX35995.1 hypothetical protein BD324DRAFT_656992 [Kockovaella imperatae]
MTKSKTNNASGIKLKFSLGSLSSAQAGPSKSTPTRTEAPGPNDAASSSRSRSGKGRAVAGEEKMAKGSPTKSRQIINPVASDTSTVVAESDTLRDSTPQRPPKLKKQKEKMSTETDDTRGEAGLSSGILDGPKTPANPSTPLSSTSTPMTSGSRGSTISRTGQHISPHGKVLGRPRGSKTKPSARTPLIPSSKKGKHVFRRPSAIPTRLLSSTPSTPRPPPLSLQPTTPATPSTPVDTADSPVKLEPDLETEPLAQAMSPSVGEAATPGEDAEPETPLEPAPRVIKGKKPLKELIQRIMVQLWRKDDYGYFFEPVEVESLPDYLETIGGEDKMMDLGTMQSKADNGDYTDFEQFNADLQTLVTAAVTYNPEGTMVHTIAQRLQVTGEKQIEKLRPMVATPEATPARGGSGTPWSGREGTMGLDTLEDLPANLYIPEEMLHFPPNSVYSLAVGWNLTGGRRVYSKRQIRGREKFIGKWRHWDLDGTRDLAELEEPEELFGSQVTTLGPRKVVDWRGLRRVDSWWECEIGGPNGIPPYAFTPFPRPAVKPTRELDALEWGPYPETDAELAFASARQNLPQSELLRETLRPSKPKAKTGPPSNFSNIYDDGAKPSADWLREMIFGDVTGEAYANSIRSFVAGAMKGAGTVPEKLLERRRMPLDRYVLEHLHNGILQSPTGSLAKDTVRDLNTMVDHRKHAQPLLKKERDLLQMSKSAYRRHAMKYLARPENPLDLGRMLKVPADFSYIGIGSKGGVPAALKWVQGEIARLASEGSGDETNGKRKRIKDEPSNVKRAKFESSKLDSATSSPLSEAPDSPVKRESEGTVESPSREEALTKLRLELVALCKYYPLSALRKMDKEDATRLLPASVRQLMSKPDKELAKK